MAEAGRNGDPADPLTLERAMLARLVSSEDDAEGLLAYALHRRAFLDWIEAFRSSENRAPDAGEMRLFLLGESADRRVAAYREHAGLLLSVQAAPDVAPHPVAAPKKQIMRTWFWPWGMSAGFAVENMDRPLNWKGLLWRLAILGLAVIVTALALRIFVVRA